MQATLPLLPATEAELPTSGSRHIGMLFWAMNSKDELETYRMTKHTDTKLLMEQLHLGRVFVVDYNSLELTVEYGQAK